jgi:hypothetical protein
MNALFETYETLLRMKAAAAAGATMYVDRNDAGRIVNAWSESQHEGHERLPIDSAELQAFLALPIGRFDEAKADECRWG